MSERTGLIARGVDAVKHAAQRPGVRIGFALTSIVGGATACDADVARQAADSMAGEEFTVEEFAGRYTAGVHAKEIGTALNSEEHRYEAACYYNGAQFNIDPEHQERYGYGKVYKPVQLEGGAVGLIRFEGFQGDAVVMPIDEGHGEFRFMNDPNAGGRLACTEVTIELVDFRYSPEDAPRHIVRSADQIHDHVAQPGPMTVGPNQP